MEHAESHTYSRKKFNLPEDIIQEILLRLPVKCLMKFKCVSKSWSSLISSEQFIQAHLRFSTENSTLNGHKLLLSNTFPASNPIQFSVRSLLSEQISTDMLYMNYPMKDRFRYVRTVGSCHGLICLAVDKRDFFLWNPSTRKSKKLPSIDMEVKKYDHMIAYGFGFNVSDNDYKVAGILRICQDKHIMMVYSLRSDSWKEFEDLGSSIPLPPSIMLAAGKLHWLVTPDMGLDVKLDIACLDLESGECGILEQPAYEKHYANRCTLGVLGDCICVLRYESHTQVDVWVLKEYGVRGSWSKVFTFPLINRALMYMFAKPLCLLPSGETMILNGRRFIVHDPRSHDSFKILDLPLSDRFFNLPILDRFDSAEVYVESLVSPDA